MNEKLEKLLKDLDTPMDTVRPNGKPYGKSCPRCGYNPCIYEFCLACGQRVYQSIYPLSKNMSQFKNVDEMCKKLDALANNDPDTEEANKQYEKLTGRKPETLTQIRERVKISMSELLEKEINCMGEKMKQETVDNITKLFDKKKKIEPYKKISNVVQALFGAISLLLTIAFIADAILHIERVITDYTLFNGLSNFLFVFAMLFIIFRLIYEFIKSYLQGLDIEISTYQQSVK